MRFDYRRRGWWRGWVLGNIAGLPLGAVLVMWDYVILGAAMMASGALALYMALQTPRDH